MFLFLLGPSHSLGTLYGQGTGAHRTATGTSTRPDSGQSSVLRDVRRGRGHLGTYGGLFSENFQGNERVLYDVTHLTPPPLAPCDFRAKPARSRPAVSARRPCVRGAARRGGPRADRTQPRCPTSRSGADALRATTSQLFEGPEDGAPRELTLKTAAAFFASF